MHGRHKLARLKRDEQLPPPPSASLQNIFDELDADERRRRRERPLNVGAFSAIDPAAALRTHDDPR